MLAVDRFARSLELVHRWRRVLLLLEVLAPGAFMLWLGLSAILVGIISLGRRLVVAVAGHRLRGVRGGARSRLWRRFARKVETPSDSPFLNRRADGYRRPRCSRSTSRSSTASARSGSTTRSGASTGPDCPAGSRVKVARADGAILVVGAA